MRSFRTALACLALIGVSSCGASAQATASPTLEAPALSAYCLAATDRAHAVQFAGLNGEIVGSGSIGLVLTNGSSNDACVFRQLLDRLEAIPEFRTLLYFFQGPLDQNIAAAAKFLRSQGCREILLVGHSLGARETLIAASTLRPAPAAAVSLSGENTVEEVRSLQVPTLIMTSEGDSYLPGSLARQIFAAIPIEDKQLKIFDGNLHGTDLFGGPQADEALNIVVTFLKGHTMPASS